MIGVDSLHKLYLSISETICELEEETLEFLGFFLSGVAVVVFAEIGQVCLP